MSDPRLMTATYSMGRSDGADHDSTRQVREVFIQEGKHMFNLKRRRLL